MMNTITNSNKMKSHECTNTHTNIRLSFVNLWLMKMKKIILILIVASMSLQLASGQEYVPLLGENKQWNVAFENMGSIITYLYTVSPNDTVINDTIYKRITYDNGITTGFMREDSTKRIYYRNKYSTREYLFYDFSIETGDTIQTYCEILVSEPYKFYVESTDSITLLNNEKRKIWYLSMGWLSDVWIEGIGSIYGLLQSCTQYAAFDLYSYLICYFEDSLKLYRSEFFLGNPDDCYITIVGLNAHSLNMVKIFPNPFRNNDLITVSVDEEIQAIQIFNVAGQSVQFQTKDFSISNNQCNYVISLADYTRGLYFIKVQTLNKTFYEKIIKID